MVEDLRIGGTPESRFYARPLFAVGAAGRVFIVDKEDASLRVFDADGGLLSRTGRRGQGPGEFEHPTGIAVVGDELIVADGFGPSRLHRFSTDGTFIETTVAPTHLGGSLQGLQDGSLLETSFERLEDRSRVRVVATYSLAGEELRRLVELPAVQRGSARLTPSPAGDFWTYSVQGLIDTFESPPVWVGHSQGRLISVLHEQYEVLVTDLEGTPVWAARVAWPRPPLEAAVRLAAERQSDRHDVDLDALVFPEHGRSVTFACVDGSGRLFVFPNPGNQPPDDPYVPVDVFSPDGELIAAGMGRSAWTHANGNHVYRWEYDGSTDDWYVVRYHLTVNGQ